MDLKENCKNEEIIIKIPIKTDLPISKDKYDELIKEGVNIYDSNSNFFTSRCLIFANKTANNSLDSTINERKNLFPNISISCGDQCQFAEIDSKNYTVCKCLDATETNVLFSKIALNYIKSTNLEIFVCSNCLKGVKLFFFYYL